MGGGGGGPNWPFGMDRLSRCCRTGTYHPSPAWPTGKQLEACWLVVTDGLSNEKEVHFSRSSSCVCNAEGGVAIIAPVEVIMLEIWMEPVRFRVAARWEALR